LPPVKEMMIAPTIKAKITEPTGAPMRRPNCRSQITGAGGAAGGVETPGWVGA
jgi:hypothetical protein